MTALERSTDVRLDVRAIPVWERHPRIFDAFESLAPGQRLVLTSDHEPRPLRAEFEQRYAGCYAWTQRQLGDGRWEVGLRAASREGNGVIDALARSAAFCGASNEAWHELAHRVRLAKIKRHHAVVEQGVLWPYVGMVASGIVQGVVVTPAGREQAVYDVLVDGVFAETALLDGGHTPLRHIALTESTQVMLFPVDVVRAIFDREPAVLRAFALITAQRLRGAIGRFSEQVSESTTMRVASALLPYAGPEQGLSKALPPLEGITQADLAISAGTVKEVVSRVLADLESAGAIERHGRRIARLDRAKLAVVARGEDSA